MENKDIVVESNNNALSKVKKELTDVVRPYLEDIANNVERTKMPEDVFIGRYLDSFRNGATRVAIHEFASIAGGYGLGVDIVNEKGEVLYTTPPMVATPDFSKIKEIRNADIPDMALEAKHKEATGQIDPNSRINGFVNNIASKMLETIKDNTSLEKEKWKEIFKRYETEEEVKKDSNELEFEYDD